MKGRAEVKLFRIGIIVIIMELFCSACLAEGDISFTYGGSGADFLYEAAAAPDGRIVLTGQTDSSDGTLSGRTKTNRAAWALCINADGQPLWSFCTQYGSTDVMHYPVFREDGSVTMLMDTSSNGKYEVEWIHLDKYGNLLERKTLISKGTPYLIMAYGTDASLGYIIGEINKKTGEHKRLWYSLDGEFIAEMSITADEYAAGQGTFPEARTADGRTVTITNIDGDGYPDAVVTLSRD